MPELPTPQIFLIDGYALIYRSFFAMISRPLTTSKGENTSAAWGVANFLLRLKDEYQPAYVAWVNDAGSSFRKEAFPDYKATREKLDAELQDTFDRSVERIEELLAAFGVPLVTVDGFEADDVIGTLAVRAGQRDIHAVIVSGDKDFYQLISPTCSLLNPGRGGPAAVREETVTVDNASTRLGVPPERVIDYLAMVGDASDNVPGVKGVGDKTARALIEQYGGLDDILANAGDVKGKRAREALLAEADQAKLSRRLVTIQTDVPVEHNFEQLTTQAPNVPKLQELFTDLEFHTLLDRITPPAARSKVAMSGGASKIVRNVEDLAPLVASVHRDQQMVVSTFRDRSDPRRSALLGIAMGTVGGPIWYLPFQVGALSLDLEGDGALCLPGLEHPDMVKVVELLESSDVRKVGHDLKTDITVLRRAGVALGGIHFDTMLASFLIDPGKRSYAIDILSLEMLGVKAISLDEVVGKGKSRRELADLTVDEVAPYWCNRVELVARLFTSLKPQLETAQLVSLLNDVELPLTLVLQRMEWHGIRVDTTMLSKTSDEFRAKMALLEKQIYEDAGSEFNINSTPQLRHVLFEKLQLPIIKKTKTGPSTDADVLEQLAAMGFETPKHLLEYRELSKLISTYVDALPRSVNPETGRVHTTFNQSGAATGRLSSSDPNLQNIPIRTERGGTIRTCFVPEESHVFVVADYSQIELRLLAHMSGDKAFVQAFLRGGDIHRETAAVIFEVPTEEVSAEQRARAKTINFATIYGQGPFALSKQLGIEQAEAKAFIAMYFERFAGVRTFLDETVEKAKERGYVETLFGRRRYIPELKEKNFNIRAFGERTAMNSPIQGSAADLIKMAMISLDRRLATVSPEVAILLQVHDELVLEVPQGLAEEVVRIVRHEMENAAELAVPLVVDVGFGPNWLDAKH